MDKTEWKLYGALYGNEAPPDERELAAYRRRKKGTNTYHALTDPESEASSQRKLVAYLKKRNILFYHVPNGGWRRKEEAWALKTQGVQPGVPDIVIPMPRKPYHGLYIELKRESGGVVSEAQKWWLKELKSQGYAAGVCEGYDKAVNLVESYLKLEAWA